jgi:hypothetical protein
MKRKMIASAFVAAFVLGWATVTVLAAPKGDAVSVTGEIIDLHCYMDREAKGVGHKACAVACAKAGNPIALLNDKNELFLLMGEKKHQTSNDMLIEKMAATVTITGTQVKKGGLQVIYVASVK